MAGNGTYVNVTEGSFHPTPDSLGATIKDRFDDTLAMAQSMHAKVNDLLDAMNNLAGSYQLPDGWQDVLADVVISPVTQLPLPTAPNFDDLQLPENWEVNFPLASALKQVPSVDFSGNTRNMPDDVNPTVNFAEEVYDSTLWNALYTKVLGEIENGTTGLPANVEAAIYSRAKERQRLENQALYEKSMRAVAAGGFDLPGGAVAAVQLEINAEIMRKAQEINETILINQAELTQKNNHFVVEQARLMEQILREFHNGKMNRSLEAEKEIARFVLQVYESKVNLYISAKKLEIDSITSTLEQNKTLVEEFKAKIEAAIGQTEVTAKRTDALVSAFTGKVQAYTAQTHAQTAWYEALNTSQRAELTAADLKLRKAIAELDAELKGKNSINDLKRQIVTDMANIANQSVASALNAVNASASLGYSGSEGRSESWTHNDSIHESHSFDETQTS